MRVHWRGRNRPRRVRVDPVRCEAVSIACTSRRRWSAPIDGDSRSSPPISTLALIIAPRAAVASCPRGALFIQATEADSRTPSW